MHTCVILKIKELKTLDQKISHNAIVMKFQYFCLFHHFPHKILLLLSFFNNISLFVIFFSIYPLIMALELLPGSPLGYQLPRWVTNVPFMRDQVFYTISLGITKWTE